MPSITERIMALWANEEKSLPPYSCIYNERMKCFGKLSELQMNLKSAEEQASKVAAFDGTGHHKALNNIRNIMAEYKKEYEICEKIMKINTPTTAATILSPPASYTERLKCFERLTEHQIILKSIEEQRTNTPIESAYIDAYRKEYDACEQIIKMM